MENNFVRIGEAAEILGVTPQTLRNWEKKGMLVPCHRSNTGFRCYSRQQLNNFVSKNNTIGNGGADVVIFVTKDTSEISIELAEVFAVSKGKTFMKMESLKKLFEYTVDGKVKEIIFPRGDMDEYVNNCWFFETIEEKYGVHVTLMEAI